MAGFDVSRMLPLYLDETDELIAALNDTLLTLEQSPDDSRALQEAFRHVHTIKGSAALLGFAPVKDLTHELETIFDELRSKRRTLDLPILELFFRCLDGLRDYHQHLRSDGTGDVDLSGLTAQVIAHLRGEALAPIPIPTPTSTPAELPAQVEPEPEPPSAREDPLSDVPIEPGRRADHVGLRVAFVPGLQLADLKARLILNRLGNKAKILSSDPPADRLEEVGELRGISVWVASEAGLEELRALADVDGVASVDFLDGEPPLPPAPILVPTFPRAVPADQPAATAQSISPEEPKRERVAETVRVDIDRLDSLMNLAGELVINKARFLQVTSGLEDLFRSSSAQSLAADTQDRLDSLDRAVAGLAEGMAGRDGASERWVTQLRALREDFRAIRGELDLIRQGREHLNALKDALNQLGRVTDGVQKGVLNTRMVPIGPLFGRFRRVVRDLGVSSGKEIALRIGGEKTELDKRMIDELGDPLVHMVRNSIDHGLEFPDERERVGKPRAGTVSLSATHRGNSVVITVADDGRGIDVERVRRKAVACGIASAEDAARLTDRELVHLIWHPGLSTAERITDISGRGVGMDIVKSRIEALNGTVDVRTTPGQGTTFSVRLPLTLAIMPSLLVRIYDECYAIPLDHVDEIVEAPGLVKRVHGQRTIEIRRKIIGLVELNELFRWGGADHPAIGRAEPNGSGGKIRVVVVQDGETSLGLIVDELIGIQEVVLKSLEKNFRPIRGLSGASILGDGRVSLILDVDALIDLAARPEARRSGAMATGA